jgi:two-component system phosphate regulon response regulator PhoB
MSKTRVLIVEDDRSLADVVSYNLLREGYDVSIAYDGQDGLAKVQSRRPDVVILDLMLPVIDGLEVCRRLRADAATRNIRILMLTAKAEESDELVGFSLGADDYVTKPFSVKVLLERVKAICRRETETMADKMIATQGVSIDPVRYRVTVDANSVHLTRSEFRLLESLARKPGRVFSRGELIDAALGEDTLVLERTIDVHIRSLRKKLGARAELIQTVRGVGYRFRDPADQRAEAATSAATVS